MKISFPDFRYLLLTLGLSFTALVWLLVTKSQSTYDNLRFETRSAQIRDDITFRMEAYITTLVHTKGLFYASEKVNRDEYRTFVQNIDLFRNYPGIQGLGYSMRIPAEKLRSHIQQIRSSGFPHYKVWPEGWREEYHSIVFLEPFDWRNQRAFGFDMFSEHVRNQAMTRARDTGEPSLSGKVTLVQETSVEPQAGFLVYVPVYRKGSKLETVEERRRELTGFVYSPFRARDLFGKMFSPESLRDLAVGFEIFDGEQPDSSALLYGYTGGPEVGANFKPTFESVVPIEVGGRQWRIRTMSLPGFKAASSRAFPNFVLFFGALVTFMLHWGLRAQEQKFKMEQTLLSMEKLVAVGTLSAGVSHEINNPLAYCIQYTEIVREELEDLSATNLQEKVPLMHEMLGRVVDGAERIRDIVRDLKSFVRPDEANFGPVDVKRAVVSALKLSGSQLQCRAQLKLNFGDVPSVCASEGKLVQVLLNLIINAIQAIPEGKANQNQIIISTHKSDRGLVVVEIRDTGIGISPENMKRIFDPFFTTKAIGGGTGLGLSICQGIVHAFGGEIQVESQPGQGATFRVFLVPARSEAKSREAA